jgi:hypothetical protein
VDRCEHQLSGIDAGEFPGHEGGNDELVILSDLHGAEAVRVPPLAPVAERCSECVVDCASVFPPMLPVGKAHRMVAGDALAALIEAAELVGQTFRIRMVVIVKMCDDLTGGALASEVALVSYVQWIFEMYEPYPRIIGGQQIANVFPVRQNQQFRVRVRLPLEARDGLRQPPAPVLRQTQARHKTNAARLPLEPRER